jgi:hypothetical protein
MSSSNTNSINYASYLGIHSEAAAIIFAALYAVCLPYYIFRSWNNRTYVLIFLTIFCLLRVATFAMRAALTAGSGGNIGLLVAEQVLYGIGFFGLLLSAFILINNRFQLTGVQPGRNLIARVTSEKRLFRLILTIAVVLGVIASTKLTPDSSPSSIETGKQLRTASTALFLALCCALGLHTLFVIRVEREVQESSRQGPFGRRHGAIFLLAIIVLFLIKEIYLVATLTQTMTDETAFYCLAVLPEFLAVVLFAVPGLVPDKEEVDRAGPGNADEAASKV